ncbi:MAG: EscU/YscU/HrcU family type III secretion system export apparatus switch protein [Kiloniellales bacterium]
MADTPQQSGKQPGSRPADGTLAIALQQQPERRGAPRVVAKGHGELAEQILSIAFDRGIKVRTDADLAEILAAVELDSEVPLEALAAVAEILSYIYRTTNQPAAEPKP